MSIVTISFLFVLELCLIILGNSIIDKYDSKHFCATDIQQNSIQPLNISGKWANAVLKQVHILIRHGARTPCHEGLCWKNYNVAWNCGVTFHEMPVLSNLTFKKSYRRVFTKLFPNGKNQLKGSCGLGHLIDEGFFQAEQNGRHFRQAYVGKGNTYLFSPEEFLNMSNPSDFRLVSDDMQRTLVSGQITIDSMFPPSTKADPLNNPVPWIVGDFEASHIYPNPKICPRIQEIENEWKLSDSFLRWNSTFKDLDKTFDKILEEYNPATLFDCMMASKCSKQVFSSPITEQLWKKESKRIAETVVRKYLFQNGRFSKVAMSTLLHGIKAQMIGRLKTENPTTSGPRFSLIAGHDSTVMPILGAIGGERWLTGWVPYASYISIELYKVPNAPHGEGELNDAYVRILFQGNPLSIPGCEQDLCPLMLFMNITNFTQDKYICMSVVHHSKYAEFISHLHHNQWNVFIFIGGLFAGVLISSFHRAVCSSRSKTGRDPMEKEGLLEESSKNAQEGGDIEPLYDAAQMIASDDNDHQVEIDSQPSDFRFI